MKLKALISEILYEEKNKSLKLFYKVDIFIQKFPKPEDEEEAGVKKEQTKAETEIVPGGIPGGAPVPGGPAPVAAPAPIPPMESTEEKGIILTEDIYKAKAKGEEQIPLEDVEDIQTLQDLLDYINDYGKKTNKKILDDASIEIILALAEPNPIKPISNVVTKGDKVIVDIDYGTDKEDSIGLKVNKKAGSDSITMSFKKDGKIIPGEFDSKIFNMQLISIRNRATA